MQVARYYTVYAMLFFYIVEKSLLITKVKNSENCYFVKYYYILK